MNTVSPAQLDSLERAYKNSSRNFRGPSSSDLLGFGIRHSDGCICQPCYKAAQSNAPYDVAAEPRKYSPAQTALAFAVFFALCIVLAFGSPLMLLGKVADALR